MKNYTKKSSNKITVGVDKKHKQILSSLKEQSIKAVPIDLRGKDWVKGVIKKQCDAYVWFPSLHHKWFKLLDRSAFIELFTNKQIFPSLKDSYLFQDKIHQKYIFDLHKIPYPKTEIITSPEELDKFIKKTKYPFLIKDVWGFGGDAPKLKNPGIEIIKNKKQAEEFAKNKKWPKHRNWINIEDYIYTQELIDIKQEFRVITVGQKVVLSYEKKSDQILKHVWRGAEIIYTKNKKIENFVKKTNKELKLDWCGWDLIIDKNNKIKMLELNPIFGTKVLEQKNLNIEKLIAEHIIKQIKK
jgi:glutathione synthase/RimK-type ligase-like ATP-grasp enzyme